MRCKILLRPKHASFVQFLSWLRQFKTTCLFQACARHSCTALTKCLFYTTILYALLAALMHKSVWVFLITFPRLLDAVSLGHKLIRLFSSLLATALLACQSHMEHRDLICHLCGPASCSACTRPLRSMQCLQMLSPALKQTCASSLLTFLAIVMSMK